VFIKFEFHISWRCPASVSWAVAKDAIHSGVVLPLGSRQRSAWMRSHSEALELSISLVLVAVGNFRLEIIVCILEKEFS
jgi:hypothetical protein